MKRSRVVHLTLVASASSAAASVPSACAAPGASADALHCVERGTNRVVADSLCDRARVAQNGGRTGAFGGANGGGNGSSGDFGGPGDLAAGRGIIGGSGVPPAFVWYYGGRIASGLASAGGYAPREGVAYRSPGGFAMSGGRARGFFGRFGGGGGAGTEAEGHGAISRGGFGASGEAHAGAFGG
ncbi:MAG TPA: hypothetical protein VGD56_20615 [Gemmatirosa sp.]